MSDFTHFNDKGNAKMVDVTEKPATNRCAIAGGRVCVNSKTMQLIKTGGIAKGDVLAVAQVVAIMGAKKTPDIIPMCHPVMLSGVDINFELDEKCKFIEITAKATCTGQTGVEMEALTAVSVAALTIYDMCKAVQKDIVIENIRLISKIGGKSGEYLRDGEK